MAIHELPASFQGQIEAYKRQIEAAALDGQLDVQEAQRLSEQERGLAWLSGYDGQKVGAAQAEALAQAAGDVFSRMSEAAGGDPKVRAKLLGAFSLALRKQGGMDGLVGADGAAVSPLQAMIQGLAAVDKISGGDFRTSNDYAFQGTRKGKERARNLFAKVGSSNWATNHFTSRIAELEARGVQVCFYSDKERAPHADDGKAWIKLPFSRGSKFTDSSVKKAWRSTRGQLDRALDRTKSRSAKELVDSMVPDSRIKDLMQANLRMWGRGKPIRESDVAKGLSATDRTAELTGLLNLAKSRGLDMSGVAEAPTVDLAIAGLNEAIETGIWPSWDDVLRGAQKLLGVAGFIPVFGEVADAANLVINLVMGNYFDAVCDAISLIPGAGSVVGQGAKKLRHSLRWAVDAAKRGDQHAIKLLEELRPAARELYAWAAKHGKEFVDATMKKLRSYGDDLDEWVEWAGGPKNAAASAERFIYSGLDEIMDLAHAGTGGVLRRQVSRQTVRGTPEGLVDLHRRGDLVTVNFGDPRGKHSRYSNASMDQLSQIAKDRNSDLAKAIRNGDGQYGGQLCREALDKYEDIVTKAMREGVQKKANGKSFIVLELDEPVGISIATGQPTKLVRLDLSPVTNGQINGAHLIPWQ